MKEKVYIGASYYPEQWPEDRWPIDLELMKKAGISVLRVAELAWSVMEPADGEFQFEWLHKFIAQAKEAGIDIILGTPTETSPRWLLEKHPEIVATDEKGHIHGQRGGHCYSSPAFQRHVDRLVEAMAKEFAQEDAVIGWQIDNELHGIKCTCAECNRNFRKWLKERYGTLERLNEECGTIFWSQTYTDWDEIRLPSEEQLTIPVSMYLEQSRFASWLTVRHCERQAAIIKKYAPHQFVTHNTLGLYPWLNVYDLSRNLDFIGWDSYPQVDGDNYDVCLSHDLHRGAKRTNYWVMEQKNGYLNYSPYNLAIEPGLVRFWGYQDIARGANGVLFYRWRSGKYSVEQNPNGVLRHDGTPRRAYHEICSLTQELGPYLEEIRRTQVEAKAAIIYSYDEQWATEAHKQYPGLEYVEYMLSWYRAFCNLGITVDLVEPGSDLGQYELVVAPCMMMMTQNLKQYFEDYVTRGGQLIITLRSGIKNWSDSTTEETWPGPFSEMAGLTVDEFEVFPEGKGNRVNYKGKDYPVTCWVDMLSLKTAKSLAVYQEKFYKGMPAIAENNYGKGKVYYVGVMGNDELLQEFLEDVVRPLSIECRELPKGVFVTTRTTEDVRYTFWLNAGHESVWIELPEAGYDCISNTVKEGKIKLDGLGVVVIRKQI